MRKTTTKRMNLLLPRVSQWWQTQPNQLLKKSAVLSRATGGRKKTTITQHTISPPNQKQMQDRLMT
jgi:hypothetical protein